MLSAHQYREIWKSAFLPILDYIALFFGACFVYILRYKWLEDSLLGIKLGTKEITLSDYLLNVSWLCLAVIGIYFVFGVYSMQSRAKNFWTLLVLQLIGLFSVWFAVITYFFFNEYNLDILPNGVTVSRFILATIGFFGIYSILIFRAIFWLFQRILYRFGFWQFEIAILTDNLSYAETLESYFKQRAEISKVNLYSKIDGTEKLELLEKLQSNQICEVYALSNKSEIMSEIIEVCERKKISFFTDPKILLSGLSFVNLKVVNIASQNFLELLYSKLIGWNIILKRVFDICASLIMIILCSPLYLLIAIIIFIESPGPVIYLSERVGPDGKVFNLFKFRRYKLEYNTSEKNPNAKRALEYEQELILKQNMKTDGVLYKITNDPRNTKVGSFLEKTSLDELPQFFNSLFGSISMVGPRPHQPREVAKYKKHHYKVLNIKPGITGIAQVSGRSDLSFEEEVELDTFYVENWSIWLDLWILVKTPFTVLLNRHKN